MCFIQVAGLYFKCETNKCLETRYILNAKQTRFEVEWLLVIMLLLSRKCLFLLDLKYHEFKVLFLFLQENTY